MEIRCEDTGEYALMEDDDVVADVEVVFEEEQNGSTKNKRHVGRAARRRRRKLKEIQRVEEALRSGTTHSAIIAAAAAAETNVPQPLQAATSVLPVDRSRTWPAVVQFRYTNSNNNNNNNNNSEQWSEADEAALTGQLGYLPGNAIRIVARVRDVAVLMKQQQQQQQSAENCHDNDDDDMMQMPVAAQLYPIVCREPHAGGKAGGRQFKSRKRQRQRQPPVTTTTTTTTHPATDAVDDMGGGVVVSMDTALPNAEHDSFVDIAQHDSLLSSSSEDRMVMEPFPTTYWLTHPLLRCLVSKLELEGYGIELEQRLLRVANKNNKPNNPTTDDDDDDSKDSSPSPLARMHRAHAAYGQERWNLLTERDVELIRARSWEPAFSTTRGVAGISDKNHGAVKCLHAHAAHYLSGGAGSSDNVVGKWVMEKVEQRWNEASSSRSNARAAA